MLSKTFYQESLELVRFVIHSMWVNIYLIIIVITIILVLRELRKLRVRSIGDHPATANDEVVIKATYLILATAAGVSYLSDTHPRSRGLSSCIPQRSNKATASICQRNCIRRLLHFQHSDLCGIEQSLSDRS